MQCYPLTFYILTSLSSTCLTKHIKCIFSYTLHTWCGHVHYRKYTKWISFYGTWGNCLNVKAFGCSPFSPRLCQWLAKLRLNKTFLWSTCLPKPSFHALQSWRWTERICTKGKAIWIPGAPPTVLDVGMAIKLQRFPGHKLSEWINHCLNAWPLHWNARGAPCSYGGVLRKDD